MYLTTFTDPTTAYVVADVALTHHNDAKFNITPTTPEMANRNKRGGKEKNNSTRTRTQERANDAKEQG